MHSKVHSSNLSVINNIILQTGLPLEFLLSVLKESVGLARAAGSPMSGRRFPQLPQPVPPKQYFSYTKTPWGVFGGA